MFSYKFAAYFQNTFLEEHLRTAASHIFLVIFSPWKIFLRSCWKTHNCKVLHHDIWWLRNFSCTLFFLRTIFFAHFFDKLIQINLRRYDTIRTCRWNFFKVSWVVYYRKLCKNRSKNRGSPCYFLSSRGQKIKKYYKNWAKDTIFVYIIDFVFYVLFRAKTDLQNKYII